MCSRSARIGAASCADTYHIDDISGKSRVLTAEYRVVLTKQE